MSYFYDVWDGPWHETLPHWRCWCGVFHKVESNRSEVMMGIKEDWQRGMPYEELHKKYGPWSKCECDDCEVNRMRERAEDTDAFPDANKPEKHEGIS